MKVKTSLLLLTLAATLGLSGPVAAAHLSAPVDLVCDRGVDNSVHSRWQARDGATYYSVDVTAEYDVSNDGRMDRSQNFHFSSQDPQLVLQSRELMGNFVEDDSGRVVEKMPMAANIRVKSVHLGKGHEIGKGHQVNGRSSNAVAGQSRHADFSECRIMLGGNCRFGRCF